MRNFHLIGRGLEVGGLVNALARQSKLWNRDTLRTQFPNSPHAQVDDIWLRFNRVDDLGAVANDCECMNYPAMLELPLARSIIFNLMRAVEGERLGRVLITRLAPGKRILPHADMGAPAEYYDRYHVGLQVLPGVKFRAGNEIAPMQTGDVWWFDNRQEHEVVNNSADDRITMIVDIRTLR